MPGGSDGFGGFEVWGRMLSFFGGSGLWGGLLSFFVLVQAMQNSDFGIGHLRPHSLHFDENGILNENRRCHQEEYM